jgi:hypothetical protein
MHRLKQTVIAAWVFLLFFLLSPSLFADGQGWINHSITFTLNPKVNLKLTKETRCHDVTYANPYLKNIQGGFVYKHSQSFYVAALFKRAHSEKASLILNEDRFTLETGWKTDLAKDLEFSLRFRTEIRRYDSELADDHLRFRFRIRLKSRFNIGSLRLKPFIATETFGKDKFYTIQGNRLYIGTTFPLTDHVEIVVNYIRYDIKNKETIHILNSGINLKF